MTTKYGIKDLAIGRSDTYRIDPRELHVKEGWNCRVVNFDPADPEDLALAQSIAEVGVKQNLTVYWEDGKPFISDGHRRHGATLYAIETLGAEIKSVPVQTEERYSSEADRVFSQLVRNGVGTSRAVAPIEQAGLFKRLIDLGWSETDIAKKSGLNRAWIVELLNLRASPEAITKLVESGKVAATLAIQTLKQNKGDAKAAGEALNEAVNTAEAEGKSRATAKHMVKEKPAPLRDQLKAFLADVETRENKETGKVGLIMTAEQYDQFRVMVGI